MPTLMTAKDSSGYGSSNSLDCFGEEGLGSSHLSLLMFPCLFSKHRESLPQWSLPRAMLFSPATAYGDILGESLKCWSIVFMALAWGQVTKDSSLRGGVGGRALNSTSPTLPPPALAASHFGILPEFSRKLNCEGENSLMPV